MRERVDAWDINGEREVVPRARIWYIPRLQPERTRVV